MFAKDVTLEFFSMKKFLVYTIFACIQTIDFFFNFMILKFVEGFPKISKAR